MTELAFRSIEPMTQAGFARWLDTVPAGDVHHYELLDGHVVMEPPAGWPHGGIEVQISRRLLEFADSHARGRVLGSRQGFELPSGDTVEPDVAFVSDERWAALRRPVQGFLRLVPDLVVEILSPRTAMIDRGPKKRIYECNGVREYWLVDPVARNVQRFCLDDGAFDAGRIFDEADTLTSRVLNGFRCTVTVLFPPE